MPILFDGETKPNKKPSRIVFDDDTTRTGLPDINESTDVTPPDAVNSLTDAAFNSNPVTALANSMSKSSKSPTVSHAINEGAAMEIGGMGAGTLAAPAAVVHPAIPIIASVLGAGAGNVVGGTISDIEDDPALAKKVWGILSSPGNEALMQELQTNPEGVKKALGTAGRRFTTGALTQLATLGLSSLAPGAKSPFDMASKTLPGVAGGARVVGSGFVGPDEFGVTLNPAQATNSKIAAVTDKMARHGLFSSDMMTAFDETNKAALNVAEKKLTSQMAGGLSEYVPRQELADEITRTHKLGENIQKAVQNKLYAEADDMLGGQLVPVPEMAPSGIVDPKTGKQVMTATGNTVYKRVGGIMVPTNQVKDLAQLELTKSELINGIGNAEKLGGLMGKIKSLDAGVNFSDMKNLRSEILDLNREATTNGAKRILSQFADRINSVMEKTATTLNPEGYTAWRKATDFYKEGVETFQNDTVAKLLTNDHRMADNLGRAIYKQGNVPQIDALKKIASRVDNLVNNSAYKKELETIFEASPQLRGVLKKGELTTEAIMNKYRRGYMQEMFNDYSQPDIKSGTARMLNFDGLVGELQHPETTQTLKALFKPEQISTLQKFAKTGALALKHAPQATRAGWALITSVLSDLGPSQISAHLLTTPGGQKFLMSGLQELARGSVKVGTDLMLKAAKTIVDQHFDDQNEEEN